MNATSRRRRSAPARPVLLSWTQHWRIVDGAFYRDAVVRMPDGREAVMPVLDRSEAA
jgi:hypothetical protein